MALDNGCLIDIAAVTSRQVRWFRNPMRCHIRYSSLHRIPTTFPEDQEACLPFCRFSKLFLFLSTPRKEALSLIYEEQLNDDDIIIITSIQKKNKLLFDIMCYCIFKFAKLMIEQIINSRLHPIFILYHFHYDIYMYDCV